MSTTQTADDDNGREVVYAAYPRAHISPDTVAEHFEANISAATAAKLRDTFGDDLRGLSSVLGQQLRDTGFSPGVVTALFHGQPDHINQTVAHKHKAENIGPFSEQDTLDAFGGGV
jgi:hypothetical protein